MAREITPDTIRKTELKRRFLGYDRRETEQLLAEVAESWDRVIRDRNSLSKQAAAQRETLEEAERNFKSELDRRKEELAGHDERLQELEGELNTLHEERSQHLEDAARLTEELSSAKAADEGHQAALTELRETLGRLETREKALAEQIAMLESQFTHAQEPEPTKQALTHLDDRAALTLVRLDRALETIEREAREEAEMILERARVQAEEIVRSARRRIEPEAPNPHTSDEGRDEYDPVAALERVEPSNEARATDGFERNAGEAAWTSVRDPHQLPERYS
jgi:chromosome segregation ATPase